MAITFKSKFMEKQTYKIWCNNSFNADEKVERELLINGTKEHEIYLFKPGENDTSGESKHALHQADIAFGTPDANTLLSCENLKWIHINSAGYSDYDREDLRKKLIERQTILTNSSAVYDEPCAQHLLAMMLSFSRALPFAHQEQRENQLWQKDNLRPRLNLLNGQNAVILGFGSIGRKLAELLKPFQMNLIGIKRTVSGEQPIRVAIQNEVDKYLPKADHIINILPANDETQKFLDAERLGNIKPGAFIYNMGRGSTIDQKALAAGLRSGKIAGAYLDVTDPEPLPPEDPLWQLPNCFITPHIGGSFRREKEAQVKRFLSNLKLFENGEKLVNRIL